jgi:hypothetical protein
MTNKTINGWTIISHAGQGWLCRCKCGNAWRISHVDLTESRARRCPDCREKKPKEIPAPKVETPLIRLPYKRDLSGEKFGEWTVISFYPQTEHKKTYWLCRCKCGDEKAIESYNLTTGRSRMCRKCSALIVAAKTHATHRMSGTKVYRTWQSIKTRCYNEAAVTCYRHHGALGVRVCDEWLDDFEAFYTYVGEPPTRYHTLDRIDPFGHYAPGNVSWATQSEQMYNTRKHINPQRYRRLIAQGNRGRR